MLSLHKDIHNASVHSFTYLRKDINKHCAKLMSNFVEFTKTARGFSLIGEINSQSPFLFRQN